MAAWSDQPAGVGTLDSGWQMSGHHGCATAALSSTTPVDTTAGTTAGRQHKQYLIKAKGRARACAGPSSLVSSVRVLPLYSYLADTTCVSQPQPVLWCRCILVYVSSSYGTQLLYTYTLYGKQYNIYVYTPLHYTAMCYVSNTRRHGP